MPLPGSPKALLQGLVRLVRLEGKTRASDTEEARPHDESTPTEEDSKSMHTTEAQTNDDAQSESTPTTEQKGEDAPENKGRRSCKQRKHTH